MYKFQRNLYLSRKHCKCLLILIFVMISCCLCGFERTTCEFVLNDDGSCDFSYIYEFKKKYVEEFSQISIKNIDSTSLQSETLMDYLINIDFRKTSALLLSNDFILEPIDHFDYKGFAAKKHVNNVGTQKKLVTSFIPEEHVDLKLVNDFFENLTINKDGKYSLNLDASKNADSLKTAINYAVDGGFFSRAVANDIESYFKIRLSKQPYSHNGVLEDENKTISWNMFEGKTIQFLSSNSVTTSNSTKTEIAENVIKNVMPQTTPSVFAKSDIQRFPQDKL